MRQDMSYPGFGRCSPTRLRAALLGLLAVLPAVAAAPASAQLALSDPSSVASCLCLEREIAQRGGEVDLRQRNYSEWQQRVQALDGEVATRRSQVDVNQPAEIDAFRELLARRDTAAQQFQEQVTPGYAAVVDEYNRRIGLYNAQCSSRGYDPVVLARVRGTLVCPAR